MKLVDVAPTDISARKYLRHDEPLNDVSTIGGQDHWLLALLLFASNDDGITEWVEVCAQLTSPNEMYLKIKL